MALKQGSKVDLHQGQGRADASGGEPLVAKPPAKPRTRDEEVKVFGQLMGAINALDVEGARKAILAGTKLDARDEKGNTPLALVKDKEISVIAEAWRIQQTLNHFLMINSPHSTEVELPSLPPECEGCKERVPAERDHFSVGFYSQYAREDVSETDSHFRFHAGIRGLVERLEKLSGEMNKLEGIRHILEQHGAKE